MKLRVVNRYVYAIQQSVGSQPHSGRTIGSQASAPLALSSTISSQKASLVCLVSKDILSLFPPSSPFHKDRQKFLSLTYIIMSKDIPPDMLSAQYYTHGEKNGNTLKHIQLGWYVLGVLPQHHPQLQLDIFTLVFPPSRPQFPVPQIFPKNTSLFCSDEVFIHQPSSAPF